MNLLTRLGDSVSPKTETISFGGMSYNQAVDEARKIVIDRKYALKSDEFPIPPEDFDVLVGLAAHEAAHTATDPISGSLHGNDASAITSEEFMALGEEIYTDNYIRRHHPVHYNYLVLARKAYGDDSKEGGRHPDWFNVNSVAIAKYIYNERIDMGMVAPEHLQVHIFLDSVFMTLSSKDLDNYERKRFYQSSYETIRGMLGTDAVALKQSLTKSVVQDDIPKSMRRRYKQTDIMANSGLEELGIDENVLGEGGNATDPIHDHKSEGSVRDQNNKYDAEVNDMHASNVDPNDIPDRADRELEQLLNEVVEAMMTDKEDLSAELSQIVEDSSMRIQDKASFQYSVNSYPITYAKADTEPLDRSDNIVLLRDLDWVKRIKNTIMRQNIRGQAEGTLDKRRLHRHKTDGLVYKKRHIVQQQKLDLVLLMDASGSMSGAAGKIVYDAAHALFTVIPDSHILSYDNDMRECKIRDHSWDKRFRYIRPNGNTPSGKALLAAAYKYPKSLIVHFTDGASNTDLTPSDAMHLIKDKYPDCQVTNIVVGSVSGYTDLPDNSTVVTLGTLENFPEALKEAIRPWYRAR